MIALRAQYLEGLRSKIEALEIACRNLDAAPAESSATIRRLAHSLRGSGGTYGFPTISLSARAVEEVVDSRLLPHASALIEVLRGLVSREERRDRTVLVVDGDLEELRRVKEALRAAGHRVVTAETLVVGLEQLAEHEVDLVVCDLVLPDDDGRHLILRIREDPRLAGTPILVRSSLSSEQVKAECRALGAQRFLEKPRDGPETVVLAVEETLCGAGAAPVQWSKDPLTGLHNRASLGVTFERVHALMARTRQPLAVAILDLDRFKAINDQYGHATGDDVLRGAAEVISARLRGSDVVARWGGEEFVVLFPDTSQRGGVAALTHALEVLRAHTFFGPAGEPFSVTFSGGVAEVGEGEGLSDTLVRADRLLYQAKAAGRRRVYCDASQVDVPARTILLVEDDEAVSQLVTWHLATDHVSVLHCRSGDDALEALRNQHVELGIFDVNMPGMNGFQLLEAVRQIPAIARTPVVMLTGRGNEADVLEGFRLGADDYIVKPFSPIELGAPVHRLLRRT